MAEARSDAELLATNLMLKRWRGERRRLRAPARLDAASDRGIAFLEGTEERLRRHRE
jgi:hypothetical protein